MSRAGLARSGPFGGPACGSATPLGCRVLVGPRREPPRRSSRPILVPVRPAPAVALVFAFASWALVGCGEAQGVDPTPHPEVTAADAAVRLVAEDQAVMVLRASNQSFDDEKVRLTIAVDGVTVVDGDFHVEDQHNSFPLSLSSGGHEVTAESDSGAALRESFQVPGDKPRYAVIDYWTEDDSTDLTWLFQRQPVAFG